MTRRARFLLLSAVLVWAAATVTTERGGKADAAVVAAHSSTAVWDGGKGDALSARRYHRHRNHQLLNQYHYQSNQPRSVSYHHHHRYNRYRPRKYYVTLSIRNHNVTEARFFRLVGVDNTVDFHIAPGKMFTNTYELTRKGYWTLFVEFPGDRYAKSPRKIISRDSFSHWIMEVYYYPESVGFSEWHKMHKIRYNSR